MKDKLYDKAKECFTRLSLDAFNNFNSQEITGYFCAFLTLQDIWPSHLTGSETLEYARMIVEDHNKR